MSQSQGVKSKRSQLTDESSLADARHFNAEALGASFQQLAVDVVKGERTDFMSRWFRSARNDADLVIWTDSQKRIIKHQLCFYGQVVEWTPINGTRTGFVVEEEVVAGASGEDGEEGEASETIKFDKITQLSVVEQALVLLAAVPELAPDDRAALLFNLRESPRMHKKARERALETWAPKVDEIVSTRRSTFWRRLKNWVLGE